MKTMTKSSNGYPMRRLMALCGLAMLMTLAQTGVAQTGAAQVQDAMARPAAPVAPASNSGTLAPLAFSALMPSAAKAAPAASASEEQEDAATPKKPGQEGIKVHGHWTINILDPDGKQVQHHEFENSLLYGGSYLVELLSGQVSMGNWAISFAGVTGSTFTSPCSALNCVIVQSLSTQPAISSCSGTLNACSTGLSMTTSYGGSLGYGPYSLTLAGGFTATQNGTITAVATQPSVCAVSTWTWTSGNPPNQSSDVSPSACVTATGANTFGNTGGFEFTGTSITSISVQAGQLIQISVVISFS